MLHDSMDVKVGHGYKITIMRKEQKLKTFMDSFLVDKMVSVRPCDVYRIDENSFYFTDDKGGVVYYVRRKESF